MKTRMTRFAALLGVAFATCVWTGCDVHSTPNTQGGRTTVIETPAPTDPNGVHINIDHHAPATAPGKADVKVNVDPNTGVNVKVDGQPVREFLQERREEREREKALTPVNP